jgi:hypothetical protein
MGPIVVPMVAACLAELVSSVLFVPLEVIRTRLQLGPNPTKSAPWLGTTVNYRGSMDAFRTILRVEGVGGLFVGYNSIMAATFAYSAIQFPVYEGLKIQVTQRYKRRPLPSEICLIGGVAGAVAAWVTNPVDVLTVRLMLQHKGHAHAYAGMVQGCRRIWLEEGVRGLWKGAIPRTVGVVPYSALTFTVYEYLKTMWTASFPREAG